MQDRFWHVGVRPYGHQQSNEDKTTLVAFHASLLPGGGICDSGKSALADKSTRSTSTEGRELLWCRLRRRWWHRYLSATASGAVGGGGPAPCRLSVSSVSKSSTENTLHVIICDNLLHSLSDLNDTTCPRPRKGVVADLAAFVVAGGALCCYFDSWGCHRWRQSCRVGDLRSSLWTLHISRPIYMCVWLYCAILFANVFYVYLSNKRFLIHITPHCQSQWVTYILFRSGSDLHLIQYWFVGSWNVCGVPQKMCSLYFKPMACLVEGIFPWQFCHRINISITILSF